jgi:hypothetical protein
MEQFGDGEMKSLVVIAYYFPPDGGAAVYRPLRFVRHLSEMGWRSTAITRGGGIYDRYDPGLMDAVPKETQVVRVADGDIWQAVQARRAERVEQRIAAGVPRAELAAKHQRPGRAFARSVVRRVEAWAYYPDLARRWIRPATKATVKVCREMRPDVLLVTGGPWSSFLVAHQAYQRTGVPYVLDFRDSWTLTRNEDFEMLRPDWARRKDRRVLSVLFRDAQAVIFRYEAEAQCYWQAYPGTLTKTRIHIVPNGYDGAVEKFEVAPGDRCTVLYTGTVQPYRCDELFRALALLQEDFPDEARRLRVQFVGEGAEDVAQAAASRGVAEIVESRPPVSSREVARLQADAHALLVLGVKPYQGYELCGSKVFGYLRAGRPIVGILPADESRKVLERVGVSTLADIDSPREIVAVLRQVLAAWSANRLPALLPDPDRCAVYEATNQTRALVQALEGRPALTPFHPGSVEMPDSLKGKIGCHGWLSPA